MPTPINPSIVLQHLLEHPQDIKAVLFHAKDGTASLEITFHNFDTPMAAFQAGAGLTTPDSQERFGGTD